MNSVNIEEITVGISPERLKEICDAERDDRCRVMPCREDTKIYKVRRTSSEPGWGIINVIPYVEEDTFQDYMAKTYNKMWWLTPEEAKMHLNDKES